jgi:hypothetical protein
MTPRIYCVPEIVIYSYQYKYPSFVPLLPSVVKKNSTPLIGERIPWHQIDYPPRTRAGSMNKALINLKNAFTVIPTSLKGRSKSQISG